MLKGHFILKGDLRAVPATRHSRTLALAGMADDQPFGLLGDGTETHTEVEGDFASTTDIV